MSPCRTYYISNNNDTTISIAASIGLEDWKVLNDIEFNQRFYNWLTGGTVFKAGTILKIPPQLVSDFVSIFFFEFTYKYNSITYIIQIAIGQRHYETVLQMEAR